MEMKERLKEPSTYAGIAAIGLLFGGFDPSQLTAAAQLVTAIASAAAILLPEKK